MILGKEKVTIINKKVKKSKGQFRDKVFVTFMLGQLDEKILN